jgi:hypothetical protein
MQENLYFLGVAKTRYDEWFPLIGKLRYARIRSPKN